MTAFWAHFLLLYVSFTVSAESEIAVSPGKNLWIGETLFLSCELHDAKTGAVWHRSTESGEEIISHEGNLLLKDERFALKVTKYEDSTKFQIQITGVAEEDSGRYTCDNTQEGMSGSYIDVGIFKHNIIQQNDEAKSPGENNSGEEEQKRQQKKDKYFTGGVQILPKLLKSETGKEKDRNNVVMSNGSTSTFSMLIPPAIMAFVLDYITKFSLSL